MNPQGNVNFTQDGEHIAPQLIIPARTAVLSELYYGGPSRRRYVLEGIEKATDSVIAFGEIASTVHQLQNAGLVNIDRHKKNANGDTQVLSIVSDGRKELRALRFAIRGLIGLGRYACDSRNAVSRQCSDSIVYQRPLILLGLEGRIADTLTKIRNRVLAASTVVDMSRTTMQSAADDLLELEFIEERGKALTGGRASTLFRKTFKGMREAQRITLALGRLFT